MNIKGGKRVAFEIMKEILEAEQRAEEILKQASVEKETMKAEAAEKSSNMIADAQKTAKQTSKEKIEEAIAGSFREEILAEAKNAAKKSKKLHKHVWNRQQMQ